jgi:hypothetical protein
VHVSKVHGHKYGQRCPKAVEYQRRLLP